MKLEVNMYVRTYEGIITKIIDNRDNVIIKTSDYTTHLRSKVIKASHNIIDLIEVGDYVNGSKLLSIDYAEDKDGNCDKLHYYYSFEDDNKDINEYYEELIIKSIVTKEQFESMSYKVGE